jgi:hypothetical protein
MCSRCNFKPRVVTGVDWATGLDRTYGMAYHPDGTIEPITTMEDLKRIFGDFDPTDFEDREIVACLMNSLPEYDSDVLEVEEVKVEFERTAPLRLVKLTEITEKPADLVGDTPMKTVTKVSIEDGKLKTEGEPCDDEDS